VEQKEVLLVYSAGRLNPKPKKLSSDRSSAVSFSFKERAEGIWLNNVDLGYWCMRTHRFHISENTTIREWDMALGDPVGSHQEAQAQIAETVNSRYGSCRIEEKRWQLESERRREKE